jgi:hypothetical protein
VANGGGTMGKLVRLVTAKKEKMINDLLTAKIYLPSDKNYLLSLPFVDLEKLWKNRKN